MPAHPATFEDVRALARTLPEVEESSIHGALALKVRGKLLACPAIHRSAEPGSLVVRISVERRAELLATQPDVFYLTEHYEKHPCVLARLGLMRRPLLRALLRLSWDFVTAKPVRPKRG